MRSALISLAIVVLGGCGASFPVEIESTAVIKGGGLFGGLLGNTFGDFANLDLSQSQQMKNQGVGRDDVDSVRLSSLVLRVTAPEGGTLAFCDRIAFFVEAPGQAKVRIAVAESIPDSAREVNLAVDDVELAPYVTAEKMSVTTEATARAPNEDTTLKAVLVFDVDPKIF